MNQRGTIRLIAFFEAAKGIFILLAGLGLLSLLHRDLHDIAVRLVHHSHLNPASRYPQIFIDAASNVQDSRLVFLAMGAAVYSVIRLLEAYGLFYEKPWAEALAAGSGAIYVPFELLRFVHHPNWLGGILLLANSAIVAIMLRVLMQRRKRSAAAAA